VIRVQRRHGADEDRQGQGGAAHRGHPRRSRITVGG
jgi:hypothetical protein